MCDSRLTKLLDGAADAGFRNVAANLNCGDRMPALLTIVISADGCYQYALRGATLGINEAIGVITRVAGRMDRLKEIQS